MVSLGNNRGVLIIGSADILATDMLIFTVLVIGTVNQGKPIQVMIIVHKKLIAPIIEYIVITAAIIM